MLCDAYDEMYCFTFRGVNLSESEAEQDGDHNITELPQVYSGRGNMASQQSAVRLTEVKSLKNTKDFESVTADSLQIRMVASSQIGPRMTLQLVKILEGMGDGNVLHHSIGMFDKL